MPVSEPLPHLVADLLGYLHETHPTLAALDGVHAHDDLLEDMSRHAVEQETRALAGYLRRLEEIRRDSVTEIEALEQKVLAAHVRGRMFDIEHGRMWERSPLPYAETLITGIATQAFMPYAPAAERARRMLSKLRQTPRLVQAARDNVKEPPGIFVKAAIDSLRGAVSFITHQLPRALASVDDLHLLGDLADAQTEASDAIGAYIQYLDADVAPRARASFRLGRDRFEEQLRLADGITVPADRLLLLVERELAATQEAFRVAAGKVGKGDALAVWAGVKAQHPAAGTLVAAVRQQLDALQTFVERQHLVTVADVPAVMVAPALEFDRGVPMRLWASGPFEAKPSRALCVVTDVDPSWPDARQQEHLRDCTVPVLSAMTSAATWPGRHLLTHQWRGVSSLARKSLLFAPPSSVEGWSHYCAQMVIDEGFGQGDATVRLGQLADRLVQLVRCLVGIRLHTEDLSVEQGVRLFRDEAYLEEAAARREAERGTFDLGASVSGLGAIMLQKLRHDVKAQQGKSFALHTFHDALLAQGAAPVWFHRRLLLGPDAGDVLE